MALVLYIVIHEGTHALLAMHFDEYKDIHIRLYGVEVEYKTPVDQRVGLKWGFISGVSNSLTLAIGYVLFLSRKKLHDIRIEARGWLLFYIAIVFMLADAFNLSIGPLIYGGDIGGIVEGFSVNRYFIQTVFLAVLMLNRELIGQMFLPAMNVKTKHIVFQPLIRIKRNSL